MLCNLVRLLMRVEYSNKTRIRPIRYVQTGKRGRSRAAVSPFLFVLNRTVAL